MVKRSSVALVVLAASLFALLAVAGEGAAAETEFYLVEPKEFRETETGLTENWGRDTVITEDAPQANYKNEQFLNTSAEPGAESEIVLRFPLDQPRNHDSPNPLPANVSVNASSGSTFATLGLFYRDSMEDDEKGRQLDVHSVRTNWKEGDLDWDTRTSTTDFASRDPIDTSSSAEAVQAGARYWDVEPYMEDVLDPQSPSPFDGFLVRDANPDDEDCQQPTVECVQEFYSSNWLNRDEQNSPKGCDAVDVTQNCLPKLYLQVEMNTPKLVNLSYEGGYEGRYVAPGEDLNFSADVWDPAGRLEDVFLDVHHENGTRIFREDIYGNRSKNVSSDDRPDLPSAFKVWRNTSVDLDPGRYQFNLSIRDSDDRWTNTSFEDPNVTVEDTPPAFEDAAVTGADSLSVGSTVDLRVRTNDTRGIRETWAVLNHSDRPAVRTDELDPDSEVEEDGNGTYTGEYSFDFPGTYELEFAAEDRPGNVGTVGACEVNASAPCTLKVADETPPTILDSCFVVGDDCEDDAQGQETGGSLTFLLRATDNHPKAPDVRLTLTDPDGANRTFDPDQAEPGVWRQTVTFDETWVTGGYEANWRVEDPDGNVQRTTVPLEFLLEPARAPELVDFSPETWGSAEPRVRATLADVNLDVDRVTVSVSVNGERFETVRSSVRPTLEGGVVTADLGPFIHGDEVRVAVIAFDTFDRNATAVETFDVDDREPRAEMSFDGPTQESLTRKVIPAQTLVAFTGEDADSGLDHVEYRLAPRGEIPGDWRTAGDGVNVTQDPAYQGPGPYTVEFRAVDVAGNPGSGSSTDIFVDTEAPELAYDRHPDSVEVTVDDPGAGVGDVEVHYRNASNAFQSLPVTLVRKTPDGGVYEAELPFAPEGTGIQLWFAAEDNLGHRTSLGEPDTPGTRPIRFSQPNHHPDVTIANPSAGANLSDETPVVWEATDPDDDPIDTSVSARPAPLDEFREIADLPGNPGRATWDTTEFPDGRWVLRVSADDGTNVTHETVTVDVRNTELGLADVSLPEGNLNPGEPVTFSTTIYREVSAVEAVVTVEEDGQRRVVEEVGLRDDGQPPDETPDDATFTGTFTPPDDAAYSVSLSITDADGNTEETGDVGTFQVETTFAERIDANQDVLAVAGALLVVLAAATVIQLYRYGYI